MSATRRDRRPPDSRTRARSTAPARIAAGVVALALSAGTLAGCGLTSTSGPGPGLGVPQQPSTGYTAQIAAPTDNDGACIDPTLSTVPGFARSALAVVHHTVARWAAAVPPANVSTPQPPHPGLELVIRQVSTTSDATDKPYRRVRIAAVPGLAGRPSAASQSFLVDDPAWRSARTAVGSDATLAVHQAAQGAARVGAIHLRSGPHVYSEILGCVTAVAQTLPAGRRSIVLFSDLRQNEPPQGAHDLASTRLLVVQACDSGNEGACSSLRSNWRRALKAEGAVSVTFIRPEDAAADVPTFLKGGAVS